MRCLKWNLGAAALAAVPALLLGGLPAAAQHYYPAPRVYAPAPPPPPAIGPHHAEAVVRSLGLTPLGQVVGQGPVFVVLAAGREGSEVQVTIDRHSGRVLRIVRAERPGPRIVSVPPAGHPAYDPDDEGPEDFASFGERFPPPPGDYRVEREAAPHGGPSVITRQGIQSDDLPPPGQAPRAVIVERDITGSVPRSAPRAAVDPLLGVPKEFRGQAARPAPEPQQRTAARPPEPSRSAPMPRPRPADVPAVAQKKDAAPAPALKQEPHDAQRKPPAVKPVDPESVPDVQGFE